MSASCLSLFIVLVDLSFWTYFCARALGRHITGAFQLDMLDDISFLTRLLSRSVMDGMGMIKVGSGFHLWLSVGYIMFAGRSGACLSLQISTVIVFFHVYP
jgi:hypothetical protein